MKILIIKLGAKGDVVRTLPLLVGIKEKYKNSEIHWITKKSSYNTLKNIPEINKLYTIPVQLTEKFDLLFNFDIDKEATDLANNIKADKKLGFYSQDDFPMAFNMPAEYYLNTLFDDEIKKSNKKTYQEMMYEIAELVYKKQNYKFPLTASDKKYAEDFIKTNSINTSKLIGIHLGAGKRWPSKAWSEEKLKEFILKASRRGYSFLLFAGQEEKEKHQRLITELKKFNIIVYHNNPDNTDNEFASLVNLCKAMICSDSFALHISLSLEKPTIGLFFCSSVNEIEDYNILRKIVSPMLKDFFPEKMDQYSEELVNSISSEQVLKVLYEIMEN